MNVDFRPPEESFYVIFTPYHRLHTPSADSNRTQVTVLSHINTHRWTGRKKENDARSLPY